MTTSTNAKLLVVTQEEVSCAGSENAKRKRREKNEENTSKINKK